MLDFFYMKFPNYVSSSNKEEAGQVLAGSNTAALLGPFAVMFHQGDVCHWEAFGQNCSDIVLGAT